MSSFNTTVSDYRMSKEVFRDRLITARSMSKLVKTTKLVSTRISTSKFDTKLISKPNLKNKILKPVGSTREPVK